jgi:hypothetical protein
LKKNKKYRSDVQVFKEIPLQCRRLKKVKRHNRPKKENIYKRKPVKHEGKSELQKCRNTTMNSLPKNNCNRMNIGHLAPKKKIP